MMSNRTLSQINKISGGDFKKAEIKARKKRVIHTDDADTTVQVGDSIIRLTKTHRPVIHVLHSRTNLYRTVRAVWDLTSAMEINIGHDDIKNHVDKYINAVTDKDNTIQFKEAIHLSEGMVMHKSLHKMVNVNSVVIGANLVKDTVVPFIEYEYSVELEV
jgi:hypothetical protein